MELNADICRICFAISKDVIKLSDNCNILKNVDILWLEVFNSCSNIFAELNDLLPQNICTICSQYVTKFYQWQLKVRKADEVWRQMLDIPADMCYETITVNQIDIENDTTLLEQESYDVETNDSITVYELQLDSDLSTNAQSDKSNTQNASTDKSIIKTQQSEINLDAKHNADQVQCKYCGKNLKYASLLHHQKRFHSKQIEYLCYLCPKKFSTNADLKVHQRTHTPQRPRKFACDLCGKAFLDKQTCQVHIQRHIGEKPFECSKCTKKFLTKGSLKSHEVTHDRQMGRFKCSYCYKAFASNSDLIVHTRFHTREFPFKCEKCNKSFAVKSHYNYHTAKHNGVVYKCNKCSKQFSSRGTLRSHKFTHENKWPHECPICQKGMATPFSLRRHLSTHKNLELEQNQNNELY